jgi:hypothetical protein
MCVTRKVAALDMKALSGELGLVTDLLCVEVSVIINETYKKCGYYVSGYFIYFLSAF